MNYVWAYLDRLSEALDRPALLRSAADSAMLASAAVVAVVVLVALFGVVYKLRDLWLRWKRPS